jgi:hypothetical protein
MMHKTGQSIVVRHKEFIGDVFGGAVGANYNLNTYEVNPGCATTFPWLSSLARQFQEYTWRGMVFHYVSTSGAATGSDTHLGTVMMHSDYRVTNTAPVNKIELLNEYFATDNKPSESFIHPVECDPKENPYNVQYVRTGAVPSGEDPKTYDLMKLNVATVGIPNNSIVLGELWCTYEVELRKPQIVSFQGDSARLTATADLAVATPFGTDGVLEEYSNIPISVIGKYLQYPPRLMGCFQVTVIYYASAANGAFAAGALTYTNCAAINLSNVGTGVSFAATGTHAIQVFWVRITDPAKQASVMFNSSDITNATKMSLFVDRMNYQ